MSEGQQGRFGRTDPGASAADPLPAILVTGLVPSTRRRAIGRLIGCKPYAHRWIVISSGVVDHHANTGTPPVDIEYALLPPGCLCCTGLLPFRVGLTRLLRRLSNWAPTHLIIDAGTESHATSVRSQLVKPDFARLLQLRSVVAAIDTATLARAPSAMRQALGSLCAAADLVTCDGPAASEWSATRTRFCTEFGIAAPFLDAGDPACVVHLGLTAGCAAP